MQISPETQLFIREHQTDDVRVLALQARKYPNVDMPTAITQIAGRQVAAEKIPSWSDMDDIWYPKHLSLEQCSSEVTARYKATLLKGNSHDGPDRRIGIDCAFLAAKFKSALRRTPAGTLRDSSTQLSHPEPKPYQRKERGRSELSASYVSGRLHLPRSCPPQRARRKDCCHLRL